jgi:hypothetical protein
MEEHRKQWISQVLPNIKKKDKVAEDKGEKENTVGRHNRLEIVHPLTQTNKKITAK